MNISCHALAMHFRLRNKPHSPDIIPIWMPPGARRATLILFIGGLFAMPINHLLPMSIIFYDIYLPIVFHMLLYNLNFVNFSLSFRDYSGCNKGGRGQTVGYSPENYLVVNEYR